MKVRFYTLLLFLLSFSGAHSQTGRLQLWLVTHENAVPWGNVSWQLTQNDSVKYSGLFTGDEEVIRDSVNAGEYTLHVMVNGTPNVIYPGLRIKDSSETALNVTLGSSSITPIPSDTAVKGSFGASIHLLYGPKFPAPLDPYPIADLYQAGFTAGGFVYLNRYLAGGFFYGSDLCISRFEKGKGPDSIPHGWEHYFSWNLSPTAIGRIGFYDMKASESGLFLDLGASYNFPIMFRHTTFDGTSKKVDRGIHQYKDVQAIARLGYRHISLLAEYRLFDFILGDYPETPKLRVGMAILFFNNE